MRESKEVRERAANNIRVKLNLEKKEPVPAQSANPPAPETPTAAIAPALVRGGGSLPEPAPSEDTAPRKPPVVETQSQPTPPPPVAPEPPKTPERYIWFPNLIEVARSYTFKLNVGNYETRDFFCSQKAECRPEDADLVSERLYEFCKRQVMKAVAQETGRKSA